VILYGLKNHDNFHNNSDLKKLEDVQLHRVKMTTMILQSERPQQITL